MISTKTHWLLWWSTTNVSWRKASDMCSAWWMHVLCQLQPVILLGGWPNDVCRQTSLGSLLRFYSWSFLLLVLWNRRGTFFIKTNKDSYSTNKHLLKQVAEAVDCFHPEACCLFLFVNAPFYNKMAKGALNADGMNVGSGRVKRIWLREARPKN